jgi:hypothetical protein
MTESGTMPAILDATADVFKRALNILGVCVAIIPVSPGYPDESGLVAI